MNDTSTPNSEPASTLLLREPMPLRFRLWHVLLLIFSVSIVLAIGRIDEPWAIPLAILVAIVEIGVGLWWFSHTAWPTAVFVCVCCFIFCLLPLNRGVSRTTARRMQCSNNMKQLVLALHNYHDTHGSFPPAYVTDRNGQPLYSWRVLILPYMEQEQLYQQFHLDEPWNSPRNLALSQQMPTFFGCPTARKQNSNIANYVALVGPQSIWPEDGACKFQDITDGTSNTIAIIEWPESNIVWTEPRDLPADNLAPLAQPSKQVLRSKQRHDREGGLTVGMADGSVRYIRLPELSPVTLRALISRAGGERIDVADF